MPETERDNLGSGQHRQKSDNKNQINSYRKQEQWNERDTVTANLDIIPTMAAALGCRTSTVSEGNRIVGFYFRCDGGVFCLH